MHGLEGKRVAVTGPRRSDQLSKLIEKMGGIPIIRPAQGTVYLEGSDVSVQIADFMKGDFDWLILTTGIGTDLLCKHAESAGLLEPFLEKLKQLKVAARGYKTVNLVKRLGIEPTVRDDDGTTSGIIRAMADFELSGCRIAIQNYGDSLPHLTEWLSSRGATYEELLPYRHVPPEQETLSLLISEMLNGSIDAVAFTSTPQVKFLFQYAQETGQADQLLHAFHGPVVALAVGKVTAEALRSQGVQRILAPEEQRMGSMVHLLADYYAQGGSTAQ
ncbi:uroporphyrinogen-III synthase [Marinicrinis lubricantis]|uniref:Uroporphyrinogen-III synthase n=1 Tax=Marinicrinis lubricantis TaxID=2086470 RepID=A0ABW1IPN4_9BACL